MKTLRSIPWLRRLVAAWFIVSMGVAMASPLVQPRAMELVCSASGLTKIIIHSAQGNAVDASDMDMDCSLCLLANTPPDPQQARLPALSPAAQLRATKSLDHIPAAMGAPPPARAPPFFTRLNQERST